MPRLKKRRNTPKVKVKELYFTEKDYHERVKEIKENFNSLNEKWKKHPLKEF